MAKKKSCRKRRNRGVFFGLLIIVRKVTKKGAEFVRIQTLLKSQLLADIDQYFEKENLSHDDWRRIMESFSLETRDPFASFHANYVGWEGCTIALPIFLTGPHRNLLAKIIALVDDFSRSQSYTESVKTQAALLALFNGKEKDWFQPCFMQCVDNLNAAVAEIVARVPKVLPFGKSELDMLQPAK